jgi:hypothetical protein
LSGQFIPFDFEIANESEAREQRGQVLLICELRVVPDGSIQNGDQMLLDFVEGVVADHIEPLEMVCEKNLEIVVVGLMQSRIDVMVIRTGIGCILNFEVFDENKVLYYLNIFNFTVLPEKGTDRLLTSVVESTNVKLPH